MKRDSFFYEPLNFGAGLSESYAAGQIWNVSAEASVCSFDYHRVFHVFSSCACFRIDLSVPGGTSRPKAPAIVNVPRFLEW
jgi:hypothetical protein